MTSTRRLWRDYCQAYADCSAWLESVWPEWGWVTGFARTCRDLRREAY